MSSTVTAPSPEIPVNSLKILTTDSKVTQKSRGHKIANTTVTISVGRLTLSECQISSSKMTTSFFTKEVQMKTRTREHECVLKWRGPKEWLHYSQWAFTHCWWECRLVQPLWKTVWRFLTMLNIVSPSDVAVEFLGVYPTDLKTYVHTKACMQMFLTALFIIAKNWKQSRCSSIDQWINNFWYIHPVSGILVSNKKKRTIDLHKLNASC